MLLCCTVAVLSGIALFTPLSGNQGGWLDAIFILSVFIALLLLLSTLVHHASRSLNDSVKADFDTKHGSH